MPRWMKLEENCLLNYLPSNINALYTQSFSLQQHTSCDASIQTSHSPSNRSFSRLLTTKDPADPNTASRCAAFWIGQVAGTWSFGDRFLSWFDLGCYCCLLQASRTRRWSRTRWSRGGKGRTWASSAPESPLALLCHLKWTPGIPAARLELIRWTGISKSILDLNSVTGISASRLDLIRVTGIPSSVNLRNIN